MTSYKFETASFDKLLDLLSKSNYSSIFILVDENSKKHCLPILEKALSGKIDLNIIEIASEQGFSDENNKSRVALENKEYNFLMTVTGENIRPKKKSFSWDPKSNRLNKKT